MLQNSQLNTSQRRDISNEKIFTKINLRQSSNDSTANRRVVPPAPAVQMKPAAQEPDMMEDELISLQRKIMDLESKLNYP
jgi:hypothetical protein